MRIFFSNLQKLYSSFKLSLRQENFSCRYCQLLGTLLLQLPHLEMLQYQHFHCSVLLSFSQYRMLPVTGNEESQ